MFMLIKFKSLKHFMKVEAAIPYCHQLEMKEMFEKDAVLQMAKRGD